MKKALDQLNSKETGGLLLWKDQLAVAEDTGLTLREIERLALENGLHPARYQRNRHMISCEEQLQLFQSSVAVIGCGALGGYIIEELARLGVGQIVAVDPDNFEEHNLNRQLLSAPHLLNRSKAETAAKRVAEINPAVICHSFEESFSRANSRVLLAAADVVADAAGDISTRRELSRACFELDIPLIHGAIAGWYGHLAVQFPEEITIEQIYARAVDPTGLKKDLGSPSFTPAVVASLQVAEICKILLGKETSLRQQLTVINLRDMEMEQVPIFNDQATLEESRGDIPDFSIDVDETANRMRGTG